MYKAKTWKQLVLPTFMVALFFFLYLPIVILIIFSFNKAGSSYHWEGFSGIWYVQLFHSIEVWHALENSLVIAISAVVLSLTMAVALTYFGRRMARFNFLFYGTLAIPEVVMAVGLIGFFSLFFLSFGYLTLIVGHTLLGLGYAVPMIQARFNELDKLLEEASLDLGASRLQTFFWITLPLLSPAIVAAALLIFVISFDDFVIAFFCAGASTQTLPLYIFSIVRIGGSPMINALSTLLLCFSSLLILIIALLRVRKNISLG